MCMYVLTWCCTCRGDPSLAAFKQHVGPSIRLGGTLLQWTGLPTSLQLPPDANNGLTAPQKEPALTAAPRQSLSQDLGYDSMVELQGQWMSAWEKVGPLKYCVFFEGEAGAVVTSVLDMENCGTTVVQFYWNVGSS